MPEFLTTAAVAALAFVASNVDDILVLVVFFSQVDSSFRHRHVVAGQYIGIGALVAISLAGFALGFVVPDEWMGLLGLAPIALGLHQLLRGDDGVEGDVRGILSRSLIQGGESLRMRTLTVAAITLANGGDNVAIYVPLFATLDTAGLALTLVVFAILVAAMCLVAERLTRPRWIAGFLSRRGRVVIPLVFIGLGIYILIESGATASLLSALR